MLTELEQKVILALQRDLEVTPRPFLEVAEQLGVPEEELLAAIRSLMDQGYIRRFGATLRHQKSGYAANALVTWRCAGERSLRHRQEDGRLPGGIPLLRPDPCPILAL